MSDSQHIKTQETEAACPICKTGKLTKIVCTDTFIDYSCPSCGARIDGEPYYNPITKQRWCRGWHRNPEYWSLKNSALVEGKEKNMNLTKVYLGTCYLIEKL